jgi:hypothetical protein
VAVLAGNLSDREPSESKKIEYYAVVKAADKLLEDQLKAKRPQWFDVNGEFKGPQENSRIVIDEFQKAFELKGAFMMSEEQLRNKWRRMLEFFFIRKHEHTVRSWWFYHDSHLASDNPGGHGDANNEQSSRHKQLVLDLHNLSWSVGRRGYSAKSLGDRCGPWPSHEDFAEEILNHCRNGIQVCLWKILVVARR